MAVLLLVLSTRTLGLLPARLSSFRAVSRGVGAPSDQMELWQQHIEIGDEALLRSALELAAEIKGENSWMFATSLACLADSLADQGKYDEARPLYERAIAISDKTEHPDLASYHNNLALV